MTVPEGLALCGECRSTGQVKRGKHNVGGKLYCEDHFRALSPADQARDVAVGKPAEVTMPKKKIDVDWNRAQNLRSEGRAVAGIAAELGVHVSSVYLHTKAPASRVLGIKRRPVDPPKHARELKARPSREQDNGHYDAMIEALRRELAKIDDLIAKRPKLIQAIQNLEALLD